MTYRRSNLDGAHLRRVVPEHGLFSPKSGGIFRLKSLNPNNRAKDGLFAKPLYGLTPVPGVRIPPSPPFL